MKSAAERYDEVAAAAEETAAARARRAPSGSGYRDFLREEMRAGMIAAIEAAVSEKQAQCAQIVRNASSASYPIIWQVLKRAAETIERGDEEP